VGLRDAIKLNEKPIGYVTMVEIKKVRKKPIGIGVNLVIYIDGIEDLDDVMDKFNLILEEVKNE